MKITKEDIENCWPYYSEYLVEILNGEYSVEKAVEDLKTLIGSKYDNRVPNKPKEEEEDEDE